MHPNCQILIGDSLETLKTLESESVQCCVTSPPYWGLRDYGVEGHIGLEKTFDEFLEKLVAVFCEVRRVLKKDGTLWVNMGDSYAGGGNGGGGSFAKDGIRQAQPDTDKNIPLKKGNRGVMKGVKAKDLIGQPWALAFALRAQGWYLRSDIIWSKPNSMPESVSDRPTRSHEYIFLLSKSKRYFYDADAIREPCIYDIDGTHQTARKARSHEGTKSFPTPECNGMRPGRFKDASKFNGKHGDKQRGHSRRHHGFNERWDAMEREEQCSGMRNKRSVWTIAPSQYSEAHFATFPPDLIKPCILAGSRPGDLILDPFAGSGTTGQVALELGRCATLIELNPKYCKLIEKRIAGTTPGLAL